LSALECLLLPNNVLTQFPEQLLNLAMLQELRVNNNNITMLPLDIIRLTRISTLDIRTNPIENLENPIIIRFRDKLYYKGIEPTEPTKATIYSNGQSVHNPSIQKSIKASLYNLLQPLTANYNYNYMFNPILTPKNKELLKKYCGDKTIHSELGCTYAEVLNSVFFEIFKLDTLSQTSALQRLNEEITDGLNQCFTGRISRLINSLSGLSDKVVIEIPQSDQIASIIAIAKKKYNDPVLVKEYVEKELRERKYVKRIIDEWVGYL
jgi:hypothetical protein